MNLSQFDRQAREAARRVVAEGTEAIRSMALQLYSDLQTEAKTQGGGRFGSPVASGRLAGSMRMGINAVDYSAEPADPDYKYPAGRGARQLPPRTIRNQPIARIAARLRVFRLGDRIYISNSVPYIRRIEIGRHSWQTPDGVFDPTVRDFLRRFRNPLLRVRRLG
jgi:hypothetical protein